MNISLFSIRTILGIIIAMMGLFALILALLSGSIHRDLIFTNQQSMMEDMISIAVKERLKDLNQTSQDLGLALQSSPAFQNALKTRNQAELLKLLNNQFHQYFVTAGIIHLEQLVLFDKHFNMLLEASDGTVFLNRQQQDICEELFIQARTRTGPMRMTILQDMCMYKDRPINAVIVPIGGLRLKGYVMVITDPTHNLSALNENLGMPLRLRLENKQTVSQSAKWPIDERQSLVSNYELRTSSGIPILSIQTAQNISGLTQSIQKRKLQVLVITGIGTLLVALFSIYIMRRTMLNPLTRLNEKIRNLHTDQSQMGDQLEITGTKEIIQITAGFNNMSLELSNLYKSLERMAYTDSLTKLPNRNQFQESLKDFIKLHKNINKPFALFLIDLDRFKGVNDTLGHHVGDELLKAVSLRLHHSLRNEDVISRLDQESINRLNDDTVARLGGDEFSAILTNIHSIEDALVVARKLVRAMEQPFIVNEHQLTIGLSIGIAMYPEHGDDMHTLVSHADIAMYDAKSRNCGFSTYDSTKNTHSLHSLKLEQDLFASIKKNELMLYYQPKISITDGTVVGAEALVRWQHPVHGMIPPDDFIPMAEQTGLIQPLTEWVLNKAMEDCSKMLCSKNSLTISVNLSALNFRDERIPSIIESTLEKWSVPPEVLTLELTESTIMADPEFAITVLNKLDDMGVSLSIDDFGTGHSSLAYIKEFPVDELKIDKSFIQGIMDNSANAAIVHAVLVLAHHMNITVVAEGVEDKATLVMLNELGCDIAQGYYFARPMPYEEYLAWLEEFQAA